MIAIVKVFWGICTFRDGPELAPSHPLFILLIMLADLAVSAPLMVSLTDGPLVDELAQAALGICMTGVLIWLALRIVNHQSRFPRCFAAILGADVLITSLMAGALLATGGAVLVTLPFGIWGIAITAYVMHRAMDVPISIGAVTAIAIQVTPNILLAAGAR